MDCSCGSIVDGQADIDPKRVLDVGTGTGKLPNAPDANVSWCD